MQRSLAVIMVLVSIAAVCAGAGPLGLDATLEAGADDVLSPGDFELYVQPELEYALGDSGATVAAAWEIPLAPEATLGSLEGRAELEVVVPGFALTFGNSTTFALDGSEVEGYVYAGGEHAIGGWTPGLELDFGYAPDLEIRAVPSLSYEHDIGRVTLGLEAQQTFVLYEALEVGETELVASLETVVSGLLLRMEIEGLLDGGSVVFSALTQLVMSF